MSDIFPDNEIEYSKKSISTEEYNRLKNKKPLTKEELRQSTEDTIKGWKVQSRIRKQTNDYLEENERIKKIYDEERKIPIDKDNLKTMKI